MELVPAVKQTPAMASLHKAMREVPRPLSIADLAKLTGYSVVMMEVNIKKLVAVGLARQVPSLRDARRRYYVLQGA